jgi:glucose/arabinose dehydrogenase
VPDDNPFAKTPLAKKEIWSLGHRSPQGLVRDPASGDLWLTEMGPRGGDELNRIQSGANYGWPVVTFGREYWGPRIGEGSQKIGMENPTAHWVPSISPSGLTLYQGEAFPAWKGNLFLACLSGLHLRRLKVEKQQIVEQEALLKDLNLRFRNVRPGPDGRLYLSTDDGQLMRLNPIKLGLAAS